MPVSMHAHDYEKALSLVEHVCVCESVDDLLNDVLADIADYLDAETACGFELSHDGSRPWIGKAATLGMTASTLRAYNDDFLDLDPICGQAYSIVGECILPPAQIQVMRLSDGLDPSDPMHQVYQHDFLRKERLDHVLGIMIRPTVDFLPVIVLGFQRDKKRPDFNDGSLRKVAKLIPALRLRVEHFAARRLIEQTQLNDTSFKSGWNNFTVSIEDGHRVRIINRENSGPLENKLLSDNRMIFPGLANALTKISGKTVVASSIGGILSALGINLALNSLTARIEQSLGTQSINIFDISFGRNTSYGPVFEWCRSNDLTQREIDVVFQLVDGNKNTDIAKNLQLSVRTVENHLRSVFSKTSTESRLQVLSQIGCYQQSV